MATRSPADDASVYERVGGDAFFTRLVDRFYDGVAQDETLRPLYPDDLTPSRRHLALFLAQYWGGPNTYSAERGHPALRARHLPFAIGDAERDAWLAHMEAALRAEDLPSDIEAAMRDYFTGAADWMVNQRPGGRSSLL